AAAAFGPSGANQAPQLAGAGPLDRIHAHWLRLRIRICALSGRARCLSRDLLQSPAAAIRSAGQAASGKRISPSFDHHPAKRDFRKADCRKERLLRTVRVARGGGEVYERRARLFQDAALCRRPATRPEISRLCLLRDEDVLGALL